MVRAVWKQLPKALCCETGLSSGGAEKTVLTMKKKMLLKNIALLFQSCAKEDCMSGYDRLIKEEEIHSLILIETPESSNSEKEHR